MITEYRLVCVNPHGGLAAHYPKSSLKDATKGLADWNRITKNGPIPWPAHLEKREVTPWQKL